MPDIIYGQWFLTKDVPVTRDVDAWLVTAWQERELDFQTGEYIDVTRQRAFLPGRAHKHSQALGYPPAERADAWLRIPPPPWMEGEVNMSDLSETVGTCGYFCYPARWPNSGLPQDQRDCAHPKEKHYSIDGEAVGCFACEDEDEMEGK